MRDAEVNHCLSFEQVSDEISNFNSDLYYQNPDYSGRGCDAWTEAELLIEKRR